MSDDFTPPLESKSTLSIKSKPKSKINKPTPQEFKKPLRSNGKYATRSAVRPKSNESDALNKGFNSASSGGAPQRGRTESVDALYRKSVQQRPSIKAKAPETSSFRNANSQKPDYDLSAELHSLPNLPEQSLALAMTIAAHLLCAVRSGQSLQHVLDLPSIPAKLKPNVQRLCFDTIRDWGMTRFWVKQLVEKEPPLWVQDMLCIALSQLYLGSDKAYILVDQAVLAVNAQMPFAKGLVNAVLRRFLREKEDWISAASDDVEARFNHPVWWVEMMRSQYPDDYEQILKRNLQHAPMTLRVNTRKISRDAYHQMLSEEGIDHVLMDDPFVDAIILKQACPVKALPGFAEGLFSVQDAAAQLAQSYLDVQPEMRVLDACAAPGGKTCHILERHDVHVWALEKDASRALRIEENLNRLDLSVQDVMIADANKIDSWWDGKAFDRVILDAPCSASGIVRRHPDAIWLRIYDDIEHLSRQQLVLLRTMWQVLKRDGKLLFCTCSVFEQEGEQMIQSFIQNQKDAIVLPLPEPFVNGRLLPDHSALTNHDGFYYCLLQKN